MITLGVRFQGKKGLFGTAFYSPLLQSLVSSGKSKQGRQIAAHYISRKYIRSTAGKRVQIFSKILQKRPQLKRICIAEITGSRNRDTYTISFTTGTSLSYSRISFYE